VPNAASAVDTVNAALASFNSRRLGPHNTPPTVDGNGNPLQAGAQYQDTSKTPPVLMIYSESAWQPVLLTSRSTPERTNRKPGPFEVGFVSPGSSVTLERNPTLADGV
jgi:hypothetical protein